MPQHDGFLIDRQFLWPGPLTSHFCAGPQNEQAHPRIIKSGRKELTCQWVPGEEGTVAARLP